MTEDSLFCGNCHQPLDPTDKFCRRCGLPTLQQAQAQKQVAVLPPDTLELQRNLDAQPDPTPFLRAGADTQATAADATPTTSSVIRSTNPAFTIQTASLTIVLIGLLVFMAFAGAAFLILALK